MAVFRVRMLASFVVALCLVAVAGCGGQPGPSGNHHVPHAAQLIAHADPAGFTIAVPTGWKVGAEDGLLITARGGTGELVAAAPFVSPDDVDGAVADMSYRCSNGRSGYGVLSVYRVTIPSGFTDWGIDHAYGYLATDDRRAEAHTAFQRMISSFRVDPAWQARQNQTNAQVSQIAAEAEADISRSIESAYEGKSASEDRLYAGWSDATLGQTEVRDPETGDTYTVESGHNYYWRPLGSGTAVGSDTAPPPDVNLHALETLR